MFANCARATRRYYYSNHSTSHLFNFDSLSLSLPHFGPEVAPSEPHYISGRRRQARIWLLLRNIRSSRVKSQSWPSSLPLLRSFEWRRKLECNSTATPSLTATRTTNDQHRQQESQFDRSFYVSFVTFKSFRLSSHSNNSTALTTCKLFSLCIHSFLTEL